jgi:phosphonate transport system substrate-binding protein
MWASRTDSDEQTMKQAFHKFRGLLGIGVLSVSLWSPSAWAGGPPESTSGDTLVIGSIARNIKKELRNFGPLADYLSTRLGAVGYSDAKLAVVTSAGEMARRLRSGEIDIYIDSPFVVADIGRKTGAKPFLRRWKKGQAEYYTLFVVREDSAIYSLDDLRGKIIAFDEPFSSSGYFLPKGMLVERGQPMVEVRDTDALIPDDVIGYVFSMDDINSMFWVLQRKVDATAVSPEHFQRFDQKNVGQFRVLARSRSIPRHVVAHRLDLDPAVVDELERVLTTMEETEAGRAALEGFQNTTRFDRFPGGVEATFAPINAMLDRLNESQIN